MYISLQRWNSSKFKLVSVDQSPAQYIGPDWKWGQTGCYDVEAFVRLCGDLTYSENHPLLFTIYTIYNL